MNEAHRSASFGVFKPVGHVVAAFPTEADSRFATSTLIAAGFGTADITVYTPAAMLKQVEKDLANASSLPAIGQELSLVKAHGELARRGSYFLVVRARTQESTDTIADIAVPVVTPFESDPAGMMAMRRAS